MQHQNTEHGSEFPFSQNPPSAGDTPYPGTPMPDDPPAEDSQGYSPPPTFDDPDLIVFCLNDGPFLGSLTSIVYLTLIRFTDPTTGWAFPSIGQLVEKSGVKTTKVREALRFLCEESGKFTRVARSSAGNGNEANGFFLNAWAHGLVPSQTGNVRQVFC